jgi:hypothetical protein
LYGLSAGTFSLSVRGWRPHDQANWPIASSAGRVAAVIREKHDSAVACECTALRQDSNPPTRCPVTGRPCEGDLAYLCDDYGCVRKAGLSPHSAENL